MSWDIYGTPLKRGHCEVHPDVAEVWPCSVCVGEAESRQRDLEEKAHWDREEQAYWDRVQREEESK